MHCFHDVGVKRWLPFSVGKASTNARETSYTVGATCGSKSGGVNSITYCN
jgi:hypothetical protein